MGGNYIAARILPERHRNGQESVQYFPGKTFPACFKTGHDFFAYVVLRWGLYFFDQEFHADFYNQFEFGK